MKPTQRQRASTQLTGSRWDLRTRNPISGHDRRIGLTDLVGVSLAASTAQPFSHDDGGMAVRLLGSDRVVALDAFQVHWTVAGAAHRTRRAKNVRRLRYSRAEHEHQHDGDR